VNVIPYVTSRHLGLIIAEPAIIPLFRVIVGALAEIVRSIWPPENLQANTCYPLAF
jgi:hypothetical protein